ncbi:MAG: helix-turn-helix transcriptional regulator [Clostridiales bacterium]|nr:helix-turn-helix transcriptional regulator [Clostridiales bacterium]
MFSGICVKNNLTQEELAERIQVTRQAVSRWETGETQPNTDTLKLLSQVLMYPSIRCYECFSSATAVSRKVPKSLIYQWFCGSKRCLLHHDDTIFERALL